MLPVFLFGFFSALVSPFFESSPFLRGCSERSFVCSSSGWSVSEECVVICCFWGLFDGCFSDVWISAGFLVRKIVLLVLGFARNYLLECAPKMFLGQALFLWPSLIWYTDFWWLPVELFLWTGSLPPS